MGTYDRTLQWRMMQQRHPHSSLTTNPYFAGGYSALGTTASGERRSTSLQALCNSNSSSDALAASAVSSTASSSTSTVNSSYYTSEDRAAPVKRQRLSKLSPRTTSSGGGPQRANALASYLPSANEYSTNNYPSSCAPTSAAGTFPQESSGGEWFSQRPSTGSGSGGGSAGLTINTSHSYVSSASNENGSGSGSTPLTRSSLVSPTTIFGMENLMADYESGFYSFWNGPNGGSVMGYDSEATTPTADRHSQSHVYMPEEELKMDYPQLPDLNQGDLDYIYGSMDSTSGRTIGDAHLENRASYTGGLKRDRSSDESSKLGLGSSGLMSPTQTSLLSPLAPSGFRNLTRTATIETKRPVPSRSQGSYGESSGVGHHASTVLSTTTTSVAASRRPSTSSVGSSSATPGTKRPRSRQCEFPGCENRARSHQKCKKHGGAHQCVFEGCEKNSQSRGLCIAHGGGSRCKIDGCTRASQSKGRCKSHGGGEYCAVEGCRKKAHLKHLCRTHGGGVRCKDAKCMKWAQRKGWCMAHAKEVLGT